MFEQIIGFLKGVSEKHIIPVAISLIGMILTYFIVDTKNPFLMKIGTSLFRWFFFLLYLVLIEIGIMLFKLCKKLYNEKKEKKKKEIECAEKVKRELAAQKQYEEMTEKKNLEALWCFVDTLDTTDYNYLKKYLQTDNKAISVKDTFDFDRKLFKSNLVHKILIKEAKQVPIKFVNEDAYDAGLVRFSLDAYDTEPAVYEYVLTNEAYNLLKLSQKKYNRISHSSRK